MEEKVIIVSNSGPIISFARAGSLELLKQVLIIKIRPKGDELKKAGLRINNSLYEIFLQQVGE